ncbi:GAF domain/TIP41-like family, putative [Leishmania lindenbergi]|uniref:GAF domain/TIP41-like family n=1 Tax=Leishmania lindenbergi TaxID=651832 RepID=A0AAW3AH73_9TRYP
MTLEMLPAPIFTSKKELYDWLVKQVEALVDGMSKRFTPQANLIIGLSNVAALCFYELNRFCNPGAALEKLKVNWFGFYLFQAPGLLALGPFQGRPACTEIRVGKGVCGTVAESGESLVVSNVEEFPSHIACDSSSKSEVAVPVLIENGSVVAVIDVDSTELGYFSEEDKEGLERVAAVLEQHLNFPMARALALNPALGLPGYSALAGGEKSLQLHGDAEAAPQPVPVTTEAETTAATTTLTHIPFFKVEAKHPDVSVKCVGGWQFTRTSLDRIMTQDEAQHLQDSLGISALPEIAFHSNTLSVSPESDREHPWLHFSIEALMRSASQYYHTEEFRTLVQPQLCIPVSAGWASFNFEKYDPKVDWAWRNDFCGLVPGQVRLVARPKDAADAPGINWDLLKDTSLPILFYGDFDMMEDDLHDHGMVTSSVKYRVMSPAFFLLFRHFVRVDSHAIWMREVRIFHEFGKTRLPSGVPHIVVLEQLRSVHVAEPVDGVDWKSMSPDAISAKAEVLLAREWMLEKAEVAA